MKEIKLTNQEKRFCKEYLYAYDVKHAAIMAGVPENEAESYGKKLIKESRIQSYIEVWDDFVSMAFPMIAEIKKLVGKEKIPFD